MCMQGENSYMKLMFIAASIDPVRASFYLKWDCSMFHAKVISSVISNPASGVVQTDTSSESSENIQGFQWYICCVELSLVKIFKLTGRRTCNWWCWGRCTRWGTEASGIIFSFHNIVQTIHFLNLIFSPKCADMVALNIDQVWSGKANKFSCDAQ